MIPLVPQPTGRVVDVTDANLSAVRAFLEVRIETSLFLLSNLRAFGPRAGESPYSGDFRALVDGNDVRAVWCLTRTGNLVLQSGGDPSVAPVIEADGAASGGVRGVLGDWPAAETVWRLTLGRGLVRATQESREVLYRRALDRLPLTPAPAADVRLLTPDDHAAWEPLALAFLQEQRLPLTTPDGRRAGFRRSSAQGHWWGAWDDGRLVSIASFNAYYRPVAQVGGVYTAPAWRRRGFSRAVMHALMRDATEAHALERLILFTGEKAWPARALYESLGFEAIGAYGLYFGEGTDADGAGE